MINKTEEYSDEVVSYSTMQNKIKSVLLIDDCDSTSELIEHYLTLKDMQVSITKTGIAALEVQSEKDFQNKKYDLVIVDINLPDLLGYRVISIMRENGYKGLIIAMSANTSMEICRKVYKSGCNYFIHKWNISSQIEIFFALNENCKAFFRKECRYDNTSNIISNRSNVTFNNKVVVKSFKELGILFSGTKQSLSFSNKIKF